MPYATHSHLSYACGSTMLEAVPIRVQVAYLYLDSPGALPNGAFISLLAPVPEVLAIVALRVVARVLNRSDTLVGSWLQLALLDRSGGCRVCDVGELCDWWGETR
ncbi:hypothetical protein Tco_1134523 [Tanacetum coccineum]